jgi:hypothetical protein
LFVDKSINFISYNVQAQKISTQKIDFIKAIFIRLQQATHLTKLYEIGRRSSTNGFMPVIGTWDFSIKVEFWIEDYIYSNLKNKTIE